MRKFLSVLAVSLISSVQPALAGALTPVTLEPITHSVATLTVVGSDGTERTYSPADLEGFPTYSLTTTTPWREEPATFEGALLSDILRANGLNDVTAVTVTAENDYSTRVERATWEGIEILVATRVNGRAHSRRARGPIQFVIDMETFVGSDGLATESTLVWMASRIESES